MCPCQAALKNTYVMLRKFLGVLYVVYLVLQSFCAGSNNVTDLHLIGLFPKAGSWNGGPGMKIAAEMAVEDINNRSDILPGYRLIMTSENTDCQPGLGIKALADSVCHPPTKIMIIGAGCSTVSQAVAQAAHHWNLVQISYVSSSSALSDRDKYPNFFRLVKTESDLNVARIEIFKRFNWTRVAILNQDYQLYSTMGEDLVIRMKGKKFEIVMEATFTEDPEPQLRRLQEADARIIVVGVYRDKARKVFCTAYNIGFYRRQVWLTSGSISHDSTWWKEPDPSIHCTRDQLQEVIQGVIMVNTMFVNPNDTEEGLTGISVQRFRETFRKKTENMTQPVGGAIQAPIGYDTVWAAAIALNKTMDSLRESDSTKTLANFSYDDIEMTNMIKSKLHEVNFKSISGQTAFTENSDGLRLVVIHSIRGSEIVTVGTYDVTRPRDDRLIIDNIWQGNVPKDVKQTTRVIVSLPIQVYVIITSLAGLGIIMAVSFLIFNIANRNVKIIRMSSPNINNIILAGCILAYISVFIDDFNNSKNHLYCMVGNVILLMAFSLSFGALFAKTLRVYSIFRATLQMQKLKNRSMQDNRLGLMVFGLVCLNALLLCIWYVVDPLEIRTEDLPNRRVVTADLVIQHVYKYCWSSKQTFFLIAILIIQGILLLLGVFLAWETRKVELSILNESRYIGICIYNVIALGAVGVLVSYFISSNISLVYVLTSSIIILCATVTQCLLFVPKVLAYRKIQQGKLQDTAFTSACDQFTSLQERKTSTASQTDLAERTEELQS